MKRVKAVRGFMILALAILISSPFVFAGFSDWWRTFTGEATENTTDVSINIGNTGPTIFFVSDVALPAVVNEGNIPSDTKFYVWFNASDPDGAGNLNDSSAYINFTRAGEVLRENSSCEDYVDYTNVNTVFYNCTVRMSYYDDPDGAWTVYAYVADINDEGTTNATITMQPPLLHAWANPPAWDGTFNFPGTPSTSDLDTISTDNFTMNNTGNDDIINISVHSKDLEGVSNALDHIFAENFTMHDDWSNDCSANGHQMTNATWRDLDTAPTFSNAANAIEELYLCLQEIPQGIESQTYNSAAYGAWNITTTTS